MSTFLVFIPSFLKTEEPGLLYGTTVQLEETCERFVKSIYILGRLKDSECPRHDGDAKRIIGYFSKSFSQERSATEGGDWLLLEYSSNAFTLHKLISEGTIVNITKLSKVVCILYDYQSFLESELLFQHIVSERFIHKDSFKMLLHSIASEGSPRHKSYNIITYLLHTRMMLCCINALLWTLLVLQRSLHYVSPVTKYTSLGSHVKVFLDSLSWSCTSSLRSKHISLKVGNFLVALIVDIFFGLLLLYWALPLIAAFPLSQSLLNTAEDVVATLRELLQWLMGVPAGLKLNFAFNSMLGRFFLYHINLWWTFLVVARPLLELTFQVFLCFGCLGVSFQVSILADLLALVSFHIYCIYVYAARLYNLQVSGLTALWRLFLGRKYNPLRDRIDSCHYTPDQLFVGTLAFTILLFLLPTTFMYYIVFTTLRVLVVGLGGLLTRVRYLLQCLPLYVTSLWLLRSSAVTSTVFMSVNSSESSSYLLLVVRPVAESWWKVVCNCIPDTIQPPPRVEWNLLLKKLTTGQLIYPV